MFLASNDVTTNRSQSLYFSSPTTNGANYNEDCGTPYSLRNGFNCPSPQRPNEIKARRKYEGILFFKSIKTCNFRTTWMSFSGEVALDFISSRKNSSPVSNSSIDPSSHTHNQPPQSRLFVEPGGGGVRSTHSVRTAKVKQRLIRMLIVIVIVFFCCWTPSYIWWLILNAQDAFGVIRIRFFSFFKNKKTRHDLDDKCVEFGAEHVHYGANVFVVMHQSDHLLLFEH